MLYIVSKSNLEILQELEIISDNININNLLTGKSTFTVYKKPLANKGDFIISKDTEIRFQGVITNVETVKEKTVYRISADEMDGMFDSDIILQNEDLITTDGMERFIEQTIYDNFVNSSDQFLNAKYINVITNSQTILNVSMGNLIFNLKSYLGLIKKTYGICLDYEFINNGLQISISKKAIETLTIDATIEDIITYQEVYQGETVAKVTVIAANTHDIYHYVLLTDGSISDNLSHPNRVIGAVKTVSASKNAEVEQKAIDTFKTNSYQHNIQLSLSKDSQVFDESDFIVGRKVTIKTKDNGIYDTYIDSVSKTSNSRLYTVTCGNMKVNYTDKVNAKGVLG